MIQLNKGTMLVVLATAVTAIFILMSGRDTPVASKKDQTVEEIKNVVAVEPEIKTDTEITEAVQILDAEKNKVADAAENKTVDTVENNLTEQVEVKAPEGPYNGASNDSDNKQATDLDSQTSTDEDKNKSQEVTSENDIKLESINAVATSNQHDLLNHIIQPIWMDQKLGDFKSIETGEIIFNLMPIDADGLQGTDPEKVVTDKNDKFGPNTVSADYNYQHMPMYNGGYYIAPMPQYLMPSVLPTKIESEISN